VEGSTPTGIIIPGGGITGVNPGGGADDFFFGGFGSEGFAKPGGASAETGCCLGGCLVGLSEKKKKKIFLTNYQHTTSYTVFVSKINFKQY
jgi:hypothetical protein